jgi:hypothetical protein
LKIRTHPSSFRKNALNPLLTEPLPTVTAEQNKLFPIQSTTYPLFSHPPVRHAPTLKSEIMFPLTENLDLLEPAADAEDQFQAEPSEPVKRNSGRTGPTSPEGRAKSSQNSIKHGACSYTLILPGELEESWLLLLSHWCQTYRPVEDTLLYDFVLKTAQAEWCRIRAQRHFDSFYASTQGMSPFNWSPDQLKKHDLMLRYKTTAERAFQREYRLLEQHFKLHPPAEPDETDEADEPTESNNPADPDEPTEKLGPGMPVCMEDETSPTGYTLLDDGSGIPIKPRPFTPKGPAWSDNPRFKQRPRPVYKPPQTNPESDSGNVSNPFPGPQSR